MRILTGLGLCALIVPLSSGCHSSGGASNADGPTALVDDAGNPIVDGDILVPTIDAAAFQAFDGGVWMCPDPQGQTLPCQCNDGRDNDGDGQADLADPDCGGPSDNSETTSTSGCGTTQCTNCVDDDGDGQTDAGDAECTGPLDDDEGSFATGIPGDNSDACKQDCWFDGNSGAGDDGCNWELGCDPVAGAAYGCNLKDPTSATCTASQSQQCLDFCSGMTPNGCDCFGCCTVYVDGVGHDVVLSGLCSDQDIDDPAKCVPCTKTTDCNNDCNPCEWCLGRPPTQDCNPVVDGGVPGADGGPALDGGVPSSCPDGVVACDPTVTDSCPTGYWCLTGCCRPTIE